LQARLPTRLQKQMPQLPTRLQKQMPQLQNQNRRRSH
jgi:hypothetical protein